MAMCASPLCLGLARRKPIKHGVGKTNLRWWAQTHTLPRQKADSQVGPSNNFFSSK